MQLEAVDQDGSPIFSGVVWSVVSGELTVDQAGLVTAGAGFNGGEVRAAYEGVVREVVLGVVEALAGVLAGRWVGTGVGLGVG